MTKTIITYAAGAHQELLDISVNTYDKIHTGQKPLTAEEFRSGKR